MERGEEGFFASLRMTRKSRALGRRGALRKATNGRFLAPIKPGLRMTFANFEAA
jgi:hypothetical protein